MNKGYNVLWLNQKHTGVYYNLLEDEGLYYFNYKDKNDSNKLKWVKVGKHSEGTQEINTLILEMNNYLK